MNTVQEIWHLATRLYKPLGNVQIISTSIAKTSGVVQDEAGILWGDELSFDVWHTSLATMLHSLQFKSQLITDNVEHMNAAIYLEVSPKDCIDEFGFADTSLWPQ